MKLKKSPIDPETKNALSIFVSSLGKHGEQLQPLTGVGQQILLTASHVGWSLLMVELNPQQVNVV